MPDFPPLLTQPLLDSDIHIWCASLNVSSTALANYFAYLSLDEKARTERFYFEVDRNRFITGRGLLRSILSSYLKMDPSQIEFVYGQYGKPALKMGLRNKILEFNLSHSKDLAVYGFSWDRQIGIDVEYVQSMSDMDNFAEHFFSHHETAFINSLSGEEKEKAFFKIWTCKEAFLKANGSGLTTPLNEVEISLENDRTVELISVASDQDQTESWHFEMFNPVPGYQAALAFNAHAGQVVFCGLNN